MKICTCCGKGKPETDFYKHKTRRLSYWCKTCSKAGATLRSQGRRATKDNVLRYLKIKGEQKQKQEQEQEQELVTSRDVMLMKLIAQGSNTQGVANALSCTKGTVQWRTYEIRKKLGVPTNLQACLKLIQMGKLTLEELCQRTPTPP